MGRHKLNHAKEEADRKEREKIESQVNKFDEGEGEQFCVKIIRVSNGFIIQIENGQMVFNNENYGLLLEFIVHRRIKNMQSGEEIDLELKQIFTKRVLKDQANTNGE